MPRTIPFLLVILSCPFFLSADPVSIHGMVKKTGGTEGIAGVNVTLAGSSHLSATTGADGTFTLSGNTSIIKSKNMPGEPLRFRIRGNATVCVSTPEGNGGTITLFSMQGKVLSSVRFPGNSAGEHVITLPRISSGVYVVRGVIGTVSFTRTLVRAGNTLAVKNDIVTAGNGGLFIAEHATAAAVDTLKAEKSGYATGKLAIESYILDNATILLDTGTSITLSPLDKCIQSWIDPYLCEDTNTTLIAIAGDNVPCNAGGNHDCEAILLCSLLTEGSEKPFRLTGLKIQRKGWKSINNGDRWVITFHTPIEVNRVDTLPITLTGSFVIDVFSFVAPYSFLQGILDMVEITLDRAVTFNQVLEGIEIAGTLAGTGGDFQVYDGIGDAENPEDNFYWKTDRTVKASGCFNLKIRIAFP